MARFIAVAAYLVWACAAWAGPAPAAPEATARIVRIDPPEQGFYSKCLDYRGIPIKAHADVADEALYVARDRLDRLLGRLSDAVANLADAGAELHIIGARQAGDLQPQRNARKDALVLAPQHIVADRDTGILLVAGLQGHGVLWVQRRNRQEALAI